MKIFVATQNKKKLKELDRILTPMGFTVLSPKDLDKPFGDVEETGTTFEENALIKAHHGLEVTGYITVADDSGICVDYLNGAPGVYSARYSGADADDERNLYKLLKELEGVPQDKRQGKYVAAVACVFPDGREFTVRGECHGYIAEYPEGTSGFGYDPIFIGEGGCFAKLTDEQKDAVSHRGKALIKFKEELKKYINEENLC